MVMHDIEPGPGALPPHTALVLSGGCLRGLAHVGVLKALAAAGIRPDLVVGTSVGAVVGALYAAGCTPAQLERAAQGMVIARLKRWALSRHGLWRLSGLQALLQAHLPLRRIEDFPVRFAAVATDRHSGRATVLGHGDAAEAVAASAAMPGFFVPPVVDGRALADGCLSSPLPVLVARALGARVVIAVNTLCDPRLAPGAGLLATVLRPARLMMQAMAAHEATHADLVITPDLAGLEADALHRRQAWIDAGERAATMALGRWAQAASRSGSMGTRHPACP